MLPEIAPKKGLSGQLSSQPAAAYEGHGESTVVPSGTRRLGVVNHCAQPAFASCSLATTREKEAALTVARQGSADWQQAGGPSGEQPSRL